MAGRPFRLPLRVYKLSLSPSHQTFTSDEIMLRFSSSGTAVGRGVGGLGVGGTASGKVCTRYKIGDKC